MPQKSERDNESAYIAGVVRERIRYCLVRLRQARMTHGEQTDVEHTLAFLSEWLKKYEH